ncbi:hypothetical protein QL093DRAFT_2127874 [Fusarium oxysporum]|nr:hypothetical protein QL093DRAFT_2127874 [Fusarium oxysporum]
MSQQRVPNVAVWLLGISLEKEFSHCAQLLLSDYEGPGTDTLHDVPLTEVLDKFDGMRITLIKMRCYGTWCVDTGKANVPEHRGIV